MKRLVNQQTAGKIELNKVKKRLSSSDLSKTKRAQNPLSALSSAQDSRKKRKRSPVEFGDSAGVLIREGSVKAQKSALQAWRESRSRLPQSLSLSLAESQRGASSRQFVLANGAGRGIKTPRT